MILITSLTLLTCLLQSALLVWLIIDKPRVDDQPAQRSPWVEVKLDINYKA